MIKHSKLKSAEQAVNFAKKSFGQNFLVDESYIEKIISELNPQPGETIIEIGAGRGALTRNLIKSGANVLAVELDRELVPILEKEFSSHENIKIIEADALQVDFRHLIQTSKFEAQSIEIEQSKRSQGQKVKLVANLPYNISTAILQKLIEQRECFSELILMLQREVVERITASAGKPERGYLSVLVEAYAIPEKLFDVPQQAFRPIPKVWSSIVKLQIKQERPITNLIEKAEKEKLFRKIVGLGFAQKRKTILNNLKNASTELKIEFAQYGTAGEWLEAAKIHPGRRAETLTLEEWQRLASL